MHHSSGSFDEGAVATASASNTSKTPTTRRSLKIVRRGEREDNSSGVPNSFTIFADCLRKELAPPTILEQLLAERVINAAWRLLWATNRETEALEKAAAAGGKASSQRSPRTATSARCELLRAERDLQRALHLYHETQDGHQSRWGKAEHAAAPVTAAVSAEAHSAPETPSLSNEWLLVSSGERSLDPEVGGEASAEEADSCGRWQDRLVFDFNVSETTPVVKGTWVTVSHIVSLIVDGWTWSDILRTHPELTEEDIRTCLAYTVAQDDGKEV